MAISLNISDDEESADDGFTEINITPLTDVFLVMLIIFFVAAVVSIQSEKSRSAKLEQQIDDVSEELARSKEINITLPSGGAVGESNENPVLTVSITKGGAIYFNGSEVNPKALGTEFQRAYIANKKTRVVLKADKGVAHGTVVGVLRLAQGVNLNQVIIATN